MRLFTSFYVRLDSASRTQSPISVAYSAFGVCYHTALHILESANTKWN